MPTLTPTDRAILDAWSRHWRFPAVRDDRLTVETGLTPVQQKQRLVRLLPVPAAWEYAPHVMARVERIVGRRAA